MITMKLHRFVLAPALLVMLMDMTWAELVIYPSGPRLTKKEGEDLYLTCEHSVAGKTAQDVDMKWFGKNNQHITASSGKEFVENVGNDLVLTITRLSKEYEGYYTCKAMIDGSEQQAAVYVEVIESVTFLSPSEQSVINGTDARVWCRTERISANKTIKWYGKDQSGLKTLPKDRFIPGYETAAGKEGNYLLIKDVNLADSGTYLCSIMFKKLGTASNFDINVIVTVPPKIMPIHLDPTSPKEGDRLLMSCRAEGVPPPTYMFYKGNKELMEERSTNGEYVIEMLDRYDEGLYTCNAKNDGGSQNETLRLDVRIVPSFESTGNVSAREGTEVRLPCIATGDPVPSMFWRRKGSQVDYLSQENSVTDVYVEEVTDNPIRDGPTTLYRRTLFLVIPEVKSEHAGDYICKADNQYGMKERTFKIDVTYKPNFNNQVTSKFYGWVGSKTNLTCIANGNPEPVISWLKDSQDLGEVENQNNYVMVVGQSNLNTRAISYLIPQVTSDNADSMFGEYTCKAANKYGIMENSLYFERAEVPEMATVNVIASKATEMVLRISPPANDGGQPVLRYLVKYGPTDSSEDPQEKEINRFPEEDSAQVRLQNLTPQTRYSISVYAINNVGMGKEKKIVESTKEESRPDPVQILSRKEGSLGNTYELAWSVPMTGGVPISNYVIEYSEALEVDVSSGTWKAVRVSPDWERRNVEGELNTQVKLTGLKRSTYYKVKVTAVNRIGASDETTFIFQTGLGASPSGRASCVRASVAGMLLVVMVTAYLPLLL